MLNKYYKFMTPGLIYSVLASAVIIFAFSLYVIANTNNNKPEAVFWNAIENNLRIPSVTKTINIDNGSEVTVQNQTLVFNPDPFVLNDINVTRPALEEGGKDEKIKLRTIGYQDQDNLIYDEIDVSEADVMAKRDQIMGKWAVETDQGLEDVSKPQLFDEALLGSFILSGNFGAARRTELVQSLKDANAYAIDFNNVRQETLETPALVEGEDTQKMSVYVYNVEVNLLKLKDPLVLYLNSMGRRDLATQIGQSLSDTNTQVEVYIDRDTHNIVKTTVNQSSELYSGYGFHYDTDKPKADFTYDELNTILGNQ